MSDIEIVGRCLKHWRQIAFKSRYGGMMENLKETDAALEALERIAQPRFQWEPRPVEEETDPPAAPAC